MCILLQISFAAILPNIFRSVKNTRSNRKNKKGASFFKHSAGIAGVIIVACCRIQIRETLLTTRMLHISCYLATTARFSWPPTSIRVLSIYFINERGKTNKQKHFQCFGLPRRFDEFSRLFLCIILFLKQDDVCNNVFYECVVQQGGHTEHLM